MSAMAKARKQMEIYLIVAFRDGAIDLEAKGRDTINLQLRQYYINK